MFVISGCCTAIIASLWYYLTQRIALDKVIEISGVGFAFLTFGAWWFLPTLHHSIWLIGSIYLLTEIKGCVNAINIISAMNSTLGSHSSKQAWARTGLGVPLAGVVIGLLLGVEANLISVQSWLLLSAMLDLSTTLVIRNLNRVKVPQRRRTRRPSPAFDTFYGDVATQVKRFKQYTCTKRFRFLIGALIAAKVIVLTLVTFEWKFTVDEFLDSDEAALTRYFGIFYAVVGLATLALQAFLTGPLLRRKGLYIPILLMPVALMLINLVLVIGGGALLLVALTTAAKSLEIWRRSVHDTTLNMLYTSIKRSKRRGVIARNSAVIKPLSEVFASIILLYGSSFFHRSFLLGMTVVWFYSALALIRLLRRPAAVPHAAKSTQQPNQEYVV